MAQKRRISRVLKLYNNIKSSIPMHDHGAAESLFMAMNRLLSEKGKRKYGCKRVPALLMCKKRQKESFNVEDKLKLYLVIKYLKS